MDTPAKRPATIFFEVVGDWLVTVHSSAEPGADEWREYIDVSRTHKNLRGVLVWTLGGGPNAAQRKALADSLKGRVIPTALCTGSAIIRTIASLISWFNPAIRVFSLGETGAALDFLKVSGQREQVLASLQRLKARVGVR